MIHTHSAGLTENSANNTRNLLLLPLIISLFFLSFAGAAHAAGGGRPHDRITREASNTIPGELGEVLYRCNGSSPGQLYIIGMGHRDALTGLNGGDTMQAQIEAYRIGEWLIHNKGLELLLPEGFFPDQGEGTGLHHEIMRGEKGPVNIAVLKEQLGKENAFINSEMLLMQNYGVQAEQIEDPALYSAVINKLRLLKRHRNDAFAFAFEQAQLAYLQERRTASMLQKIPGIIESWYENGGIRKRQALFTIGLAHLNDIIRYLKEKKITIRSPLFTSFEDYTAGVHLLQEDFGVTIIVPPSLKHRSSSLIASHVR